MKLTLQDLVSVFTGARHDHPGRKGSVIPKGRSGHFPRFRQKKHYRTYGEKYHQLKSKLDRK